MFKSYKSTKGACYIGYVVQAIINNFLPILFIILQDRYEISYEKLGRLVFINFFVQLIADMLTPLIVKRIGYKKTALVCHACAAFGLCMLGILPSVMKDTYSAIVLSIMVYAFGSGIIEVVVSPMIELLPSDNKAASMAFLHSAFCWGQAFTVVVTTLMVAVFKSANWQFIPVIWAIIPFLNFFVFLNSPVVEPDAEEKKVTTKEMLFSRDFFCFVIFMICAGASEVAMSQWASIFVQKGLNISKVTGDILGPCAFAIAMGLGRIIFGMFAGRYSMRKVLIINNIICCLCYITVAFVNIPALALLACALCGFTVSISWPGTYSMAAARFVGGGTLMFSIFALSGDIGCSVGPWLLGIVANSKGLNSGFAVCVIFPLLMVLTALFLYKEKNQKNGGIENEKK